MRTQHREITLRFLAEPTDINFGGKVHGGAVMKWIDQAGYACAVGWSGRYCVTVYVGGIRFYKPILLGSVVEVHCRLIYTGKTSMHIAATVRAGDPKVGDFDTTTQCVIVFVAVDEEGKPTQIAPWVPESDEDLAQQRYAEKLMELRQGLEAELARHGTA